MRSPCSATPLYAGPLETAFDACCRVHAGQALGTGFVYGADTQYIAVMTNWHVVTAEGKQSPKVVQCQFWQSGYASTELPGQVIAADQRVDAAVILVRRDAFGGHDPQPMPFAVASPLPGAEVHSVGCAGGAWATAWRGHVVRYSPDSDMIFQPAPAGGRSGSAICNADGHIVGLVQARAADNSYGVGIPVERIMRAMRPAVQESLKTFVPCSELAQCPGGMCPVPYASPMAPSADPYPGLSVQAEPPSALLPWRNQIDKKLEQIDQKLSVPSVPPAALPPMPMPSPIVSGPDPSILDRLGRHDQAIGELQCQVRAIDGKIDANDATSRQRHETLLQALQQGPQATVAKVKEDFTDNPLRSLLITVGVVVAVFFFVTVCVFHLIALWRQKADATAAANPNNAADQRQAQFLDKLDNFNRGIDQKLAQLPVIGGLYQPGGPAGAVASPPLAGAAGHVAAAGPDPTNAAVTAALVQGAIQTALATPAPGQANPTTGVSPVGNASQPAPAVVIHANPTTPAAATAASTPAATPAK